MLLLSGGYVQPYMVSGSIECETEGTFVLYVGEENESIEQSGHVDDSIPNSQKVEWKFNDTCSNVNIRIGETIEEVFKNVVISTVEITGNCTDPAIETTDWVLVEDNQYVIFEIEDSTYLTVSGEHVNVEYEK